MQRIELELDHSNFFCPVTGVQMLSSEMYDPSPATLFDYPEVPGMFSWHCPELEELEATVNTEEVVDECKDDLTNLERFLVAIKVRPNLVLFSLTTSGIACGPSSETFHICIDMNYQAGGEEEDDEG